MSGPLVSASTAFVAKNSRKPPYEIEQSLRLNKTDQSYVNKVFSSAGDEQKFTISFWFKICHVSKSTADNLVGAGEGGNNFFLIDVEKTSVGEFLHITNYTPATGYEFDLKTNRAIRDPSAWMHLVLAVDTTQATPSNRAKVWLNGVQETSFATENYPSQNGTAIWWGGNSSNGAALSSQETAIGRRPPGGPEYANAYIAEFNSIDGQYLTHEDFGEFDQSGVWRPIKYTGTYTGNSFYLKFDASDVDGDSSGLGNDFTANNISTSGTGTDVMSDTPTNNHCTWNPLSKASNSPDPTDGNLRGGLPGAQNGTFAVSSGKWYWETKYISGNGYAIATGVGAVDLAQPAGGFSTGIIYYGGTGGTYGNDMGLYNFSGSPDTSYGTGGFWTGGHFGVMLDLDSSPQTIAFSKDGTTYSTVNIPSDKQGLTYVPLVQGGSASTTGSWDLFVDENTWTYTPPTGFKALNTKNLPAPEIKDGSDYFNTVTYTGTGATQTVTGVGFQPDFVWAKSRTNAYSHQLYDAVRGAGKSLVSNITGAESTVTYLNAFTSDGFTLDSDAGINASGASHVAWNWLAGNGTSSNTDGTITSTVSTNPTAGFSIVSYTASGTDNDTVGHGLGVEPSFHIVKSRDGARDWLVYTREIDGSLDFLRLNRNAAAANSSANAPTSTVFSIYGADINTAGEDCIAYCFAEVEGYSKFGSYTGNNTTDNAFVYCGFAPAWLLVKSYGTGGTNYDWRIYDNKRNTYNPVDDHLEANSGLQENGDSRSNPIDFLSNGFKVRQSYAEVGSSTTYIFAAFAENPFGGSGVNPATAR